MSPRFNGRRCALPKAPACRGNDRGAILTTIFGTFESVEIKAVPTAPTPTKKRGWLPLLTILFMISYGLMTMLIVEQGQTIESQRALIRELFRDSSELSAVKMKAQEQRMHALAQNQASQIQSTQNPSSQSHQTRRPRPRLLKDRPRLPRRKYNIVHRIARRRSRSSRCRRNRRLIWWITGAHWSRFKKQQD